MIWRQMEKWFETIFYSERVNGGCGCACINQAKVPIATSHTMICWYIDSFVCRPSIKSTHVCASAVTSTCTTNKNATRTSHTGTHCYRNTNIWNIRIWSSNVTEHWLNPSNDDDDNGDVMTHCHRCLCLCHECKHEVSFAFLSLSQSILLVIPFTKSVKKTRILFVVQFGHIMSA